MTSPHLLAIDNGTQSTRALLFDLQGQLVDGGEGWLLPFLAVLLFPYGVISAGL